MALFLSHGNAWFHPHKTRLGFCRAILSVLAFASCSSIAWASFLDSPPPEPTAAILSPNDFARIRCALDERTTIFSWEGKIFAQLPGEAQKHLFNMVGINVSNCFPIEEGVWGLSGRELVLYLDPASGAVLKQWENPWNKEVLPVVHALNDPVQIRIQGNFPYSNWGSQGSVSMNVPLTYPNPLAGDARLVSYGGNQALYQAVESFQWQFPIEALRATSPAIADVSGSWFRVGPWMPFMKMEDRQGLLIYSAAMRKLVPGAPIDARLQQVIDQKLPGFLSPPHCWEKLPNMTSWKYFRQHFEDYLRGAEFPLATESHPSSCHDNLQPAAPERRP